MNAEIHTPLTDLQLDGHACMRCGRSFFSDGSLSSPTRHTDGEKLLFVCSGGWGCSAADPQTAATGTKDPLDPDAVASTVKQRMADAFRQSGQTLPQLAGRIRGITVERLTELLDGRDDGTVSEILVIGHALGCRAADWFRIDGVDSEVGQ